MNYPTNYLGVLMHRSRISIFLAGAALIALTAPAIAAAKKAAPAPLPSPDPRIAVLEQELRDIQQQLKEIKGAPDYSSAVLDLKRSTSDQYADLGNQLAAQNKVSLDNARLTVTSPNGAF